MFQIYKLSLSEPVDFAAAELKKYLRMMMPGCGEIDIAYDPNATNGFRLGLLEEFGLPNEAEDPELDDIVHIDTRSEGGVLAGPNPRSVLVLVPRNGWRVHPQKNRRTHKVPQKGRPPDPVSYHRG